MKRLRLGRLGLVGAVALALSACTSEPPPVGSVAVSRPAPEIVAQDLTGRPARLSELRGKVVVLDFWATW